MSEGRLLSRKFVLSSPDPSKIQILNKRNSPFPPLFLLFFSFFFDLYVSFPLTSASRVACLPPLHLVLFDLFSPPLALCTFLLRCSQTAPAGNGILVSLLFQFYGATSVVVLSPGRTRCRLILPYDATPVPLLPLASALTRLLHALRRAGITIRSDSCPSLEVSLQSLSAPSLPWSQRVFTATLSRQSDTRRLTKTECSNSKEAIQCVRHLTDHALMCLYPNQSEANI